MIAFSETKKEPHNKIHYETEVSDHERMGKKAQDG